MAITQHKPAKKTRKIEKVLRYAMPFLVAAGLVNGKRQRQELRAITAVMGHKIILLPNKKIATTQYLRRGMRYIVLKDGEPLATVDMAPRAKGERIRYHVTYGPTVAPLYRTMQWVMTERRVPESKIIALIALPLGKNFLYDERMKNRILFEVTESMPPGQMSTKELLRLNNQMVTFLQKEHRKFKIALKRRLKEIPRDVAIPATAQSA